MLTCALRPADLRDWHTAGRPPGRPKFSTPTSVHNLRHDRHAELPCTTFQKAAHTLALASTHHLLCTPLLLELKQDHTGHEETTASNRERNATLSLGEHVCLARALQTRMTSAFKHYTHLMQFWLKPLAITTTGQPAANNTTSIRIYN